MAYFEDLTAYSYMGEIPDQNLLNVGWLEKGYEYPQGSVEPEVLSLILMLASKSPTRRSRGFHVCPFCSNNSFGLPVIDTSGKRLLLGSAEIRVKGKGDLTYACPDLIYHYISVHSYLPPQEFIDSLMLIKS